MPNPDRYEVPVFDPDSETSCSSEHNRVVAMYHEDSNLRVVLDDVGSENDGYQPSIFIERQAGHWLIVIHPDDGDPLCGVEIHDNGTCQVQDDYGKIVIVERRHTKEEDGKESQNSDKSQSAQG